MKVKIFLTAFFLGLLLIPNFAFAVQAEVTESVMGQIKAAAGKAEIEEPVSVQGIVTTTIRTLLTTVGAIFVALVVYGGFLFINARGEEEQVEKGKKIVLASVIGLIIILMSYSITIFIGSRVNPIVTEGQEVAR